MKIAAPLLMALSACAVHRESAVQVDEAAQQEEESHAAESVEIHRIEEPSRVTTTVDEFGAPEPSISDSAAPPSRTAGPPLNPGAPRGLVPQLDSGIVVLPFHGPLVKRTVTLEERGQVSETTSAKGSSEATAAATATIAAKADSERDSKPSLGLPCLGLLLAGIAASAILTRGIWLGPLLGFIRGKL